MVEGFNRVLVRCNTLVVLWILFGAIISGSGIKAYSQEQQNPATIIPQAGPEIPVIVPDKPKPLYQSACPAWSAGKFTAKLIKPIIDGDCGERSPLLVSHVGEGGNIRLTPPPQINCRMATAMVEWVKKVQLASHQELGTTLKSISVGNGYQCRRRNNLPDGKISEHGFANALDIIGFRFEDGSKILVEESAPAKNSEYENTVAQTLQLNFLKSAHTSACELFTTVLGPQADEHHRDHFHLDLGCHGKNCTYKICE